MGFSVFIQQKSRSLWVVGVLLVALFLRGMVPTGYMPTVATHDGQLFTLTICSGTGPKQINIDPSQPEKQTPHKAAQDGTCSFSAHSFFTLTSTDGLKELPRRPALLLLLGLFSIALFTALPFGNASPRSPPRRG